MQNVKKSNAMKRGNKLRNYVSISVYDRLKATMETSCNVTKDWDAIARYRVDLMTTVLFLYIHVWCNPNRFSHRRIKIKIQIFKNSGTFQSQKTIRELTQQLPCCCELKSSWDTVSVRRQSKIASVHSVTNVQINC